MSDFAVKITRVSCVENHPNADRLSIIKMEGNDFTTISSKVGDGEHRYKQGEYVAYIPEAALFPEWLLKRLDFWDHDTNKGTLRGPDGNRLTPMKLRGVVSQGMLYPVPNLLLDVDGTNHSVELDQDVADILGIEKWTPPIPQHMSGEVKQISGIMKYDFENWKSVPDIFEEDLSDVVVSEKIHGTFSSITFSNLSDDDLFGIDHDIIVASKGLGAKGLVFINNEANDKNLYVKNLKKLLTNGLEEKIADFRKNLGRFAEITIFGEIFGVQDLKYGLTEPDFRAFDVALNKKFICYRDLKDFLQFVGIEMVPVLYSGPFTKAKMLELRDGKTILGGNHIREGIVVKTLNEEVHPAHGRKIAKFVSDAYLFRKGEVTEYA